MEQHKHTLADFVGAPKPGIAVNAVGDGDIIYRQACKLGCEGMVCKRIGSMYRNGSRSRTRRRRRCGARPRTPLP
jgi:ATP-dependent DNA ligase